MDIGSILLQWQSAGIFEYVLPFLLIFAIVFGILEAAKIGFTKERKLNVIIALVVGLLAVGYTSRMNFSVGQFLQEIFPRLGVGIAVLLVILILVGVFINEDDRKYWMWGLSAIAFIVAIVIITESFNTFGWYSSGYYGDYVGWIIGAVLLIGIVIAVAAGGSDKTKPAKTS